jgi:FkbM family methyltransferase
MKSYELFARMWMTIPASLRSVYQTVSGNHSFASLVLPDRMQDAEIKAGIAKGMEMQLNLQRERSFFLGMHEEDVQGCLLKHVKQGMTVYNVGAHIGFFTLGLGRLVGDKGRVVCFEPNPEARERLIGHVYLNRIDDRVHIEDSALSDIDGHAEFSMTLSNTQGRFVDLPHVKPGSIIQVSCKRLDTYVHEGGPVPDVVLMDVEHAEGRVLRGMDETLENRRPIIVLEMHGPDSIREAWTELKKHNYTLTNISNSRAVATVEDIAYGHYLALPSNSLEQIPS